MGKNNNPEIIWRQQGGTRRAYLDERRWGGPRQAALKPAGSNRATTDPQIARELAAARIQQLEAQRREEEARAAEATVLVARLGLNASATFDAYAGYHISLEAQRTDCSPAWLAACELMLVRALHFFDKVQPAIASPEQRKQRPGLSSPRNLATISTADVSEYVRWLGSEECWKWELSRRAAEAEAGGRRMAGGKSGPFGDQHRLHHLSALSRMFKRAVHDRLLATNPVRELFDKPSAPKSTTQYLTPPELALVLEAARTYDPVRVHGGREPLSCVYELVAFLILTGCRMDEARRAQWSDVHLQKGGLEIRGTKNITSDRLIPLHAQLAEILTAYRSRTGRISGPLFPSDRTGDAFGDARKALNAVADRAGVPRAMLRSRPLRASYATARVVSLDNGREVTPEMVRQELGHTYRSRVLEDRYVKRARLLLDRLDPFEFRIERYADRPEIADRLDRMRALDAAGVPPLSVAAEEARAERQQLIREFLSAVDGLTIASAMEVSGVERSAIQRLRAGTADDVKGKTLTKIREYLQRRKSRASA